jgi:hypothetical protein
MSMVVSWMTAAVAAVAAVAIAVVLLTGTAL